MANFRDVGSRSLGRVLAGLACILNPATSFVKRHVETSLLRDGLRRGIQEGLNRPPSPLTRSKGAAIVQTALSLASDEKAATEEEGADGRTTGAHQLACECEGRERSALR